mmetsp:Transcript_26048/g.53101  ORF Transcript_26048/g.53101 Transcript_26048/m.53101 type:complete len:113 (-) Transcript_26048:26-364(-)
MNEVIAEQVRFVEKMILDASPEMKVNYQSYLQALREGLLKNHQGRYIYISKGRMLNKSFKYPHDVTDYFHIPLPNTPSFFTYSTVIYVPPMHKLADTILNSSKVEIFAQCRY